MKKLFLSNLIFLVLINLLIKPFYLFVIEVGVQNKVGPEEYGVFFSLFNFCYLFQIITDLGLNNYNNTSVAKDEGFLSQNISNILGLKLVLAFLFFSFIWIVSYFIGYPDSYYPLLWFIASNQILVSFILYFRTNISGSGFYKWDSVLSVLDKFILIIILAYLLWTPLVGDSSFNVLWFVYAQMVSLLITLLLVVFVLIGKVGTTSLKLIPSFDHSILKRSLPFAIIVLVMSAYSRIDSVMLERLLDDNGKEAGIYAASYRILDALNIVGFLFAGLLLPMFSKLIASGEDTRSTLILSYKLLIAIAISVAIYGSCFGDQLMLSLYPDYSNLYYTSILKLLIWGFLGIATTHIFGTLLTADHSLKKMNIVFILGLIINVLLNWYLIPKYKAEAAALTTLITETFVAIGLVSLVVNKFKYKIELRPIISLLTYGFILFAFYYSLSAVLHLGWLLSLFLGIIVSFVVSLLLDIIDIRELKATLINR